MRLPVRTFATPAILALLSSTALAQTAFQNPGTGSWFNGANWDNGVPNGNDADVLNGGTAQLDTGATGIADTLTINAPSSVQIINGSTLEIVQGDGNGSILIDNGTLRSEMTPGVSTTIANPLIINNGGAILDSNGANALDLTGGMSGTGALSFVNSMQQQDDLFDFILSGTSSRTGATEVTSTVVQLTADNALGTGSLNIESGGAVALGANMTQTVSNLTGSGTVAATGYSTTPGSYPSTLIVQAGDFSGTLEDGFATGPGLNTTGTLTVVKTTAGILTLDGPGKYSGGTQLQQGTIEVGYGNALGTGALVMSDGTTLRLAESASQFPNGVGLNNPTVLNGTNTIDTQDVAGGLGLHGVVSGTGTLVKVGSSGLGLYTANTYSGGTIIDAGRITDHVNGALGTGTLTFAGGNLRAGADNLSVSNVAALTADGQIDTQDYTLTYAGQINGPGSLTKIGTGSLILSGADTYTGVTTVNAGTLVATGSLISGVTVDSGATIGGSGIIGSLNTLSGSSLSPGAIAPFSNLRVAGNAALASGTTYTVHVNGAGQTDALTVGGTTTIGGGTVSVLPTAGAYATTTRYTILTSAGGATGQFTSVTSSLPYLSPTLSYDPNHVYVDLQFVPALTSQAAQAHSSVPTLAITSARTIVDTIFDRLWNIPSSNDAATAFDQFGSLPANPLLRCYDDAQPTAPRGTVPANYTVWGQAIGDFFRDGGSSGSPSVDNVLGGVVFGIDSRVDNKLFNNWRVGVSGGYTNDSFSVGQGGGNGTFENAFGALYAGARYGAIDVKLGASYGGTSTTVHRTAVFPGFFEAEKSNNGGDTVQGFGELGYRFSFSQAVFEPIVDAGATHVRQDSYREKGGAAALFGFKQDTDVEFTTLGFRAEATPFAQYPLVAHLMLGWEHSYGDVNPASTLAFASGSAAFNVYGTPLDRDQAVTETDFVWRATPATSVTLAYTGQIGPRDRENGVRGRVDYRF